MSQDVKIKAVVEDDPAMETSALFVLVVGLLFFISVAAIQNSLFSGRILVLWPPEGLIVGLMLALPARRPWIIMTAGLSGVAIAFAFFNSQTLLAWSRLGMMAAEMPLIYWGARRIIGSRSIAEPRALLPFMGLCAVTGLAASAARACLFHQVWGVPFAQFTMTAATASFTGYAVMTPLVLVLKPSEDQSAGPWQAKLAMWGLVGLYVAAVTAFFIEPRYPTAYLIPVALILLAHVVDFTGIAVAILATAIISVALTFHGYGPISHFSGDLKSKVLLTQAFLATIVCLTLPFSALNQDRRRMQRSLVTALKDAELASRAKSAFLATISHEIRTPLNGILGMAQAIAMGELSPKQRERLAIVNRSGETLLALLNDVLDLSKIEAGRLTLEAMDFDLAEVIDAVAAQSRGLAANKGLVLQAMCEGADGIYHGDPNRVRQIVQNLVSNALKFTDKGAITITAMTGLDGLEVRVKDTGVGIPADKFEVLFEKFRQLDESTTRRFGGTGLGLSICRELAHAMGGDITVQSAEGQGSTFTLRLPMRRLRSVAARPQTVQPAYRPPALALRVLVAEDNPTNQVVLKTLLNAAGIEPTVVANGAEALAACTGATWDLILMDVHMPVMDGLEAVRAIRRQEAQSDAPRTRIVALTADVMDRHVRQSLAVGMDGHLSKPIAIEQLFEVLAQSDPAHDPARAQAQAQAPTHSDAA